MNPLPDSPLGFFELARRKPGIDDARPLLVREFVARDALVRVDPALASWLPDRPPEPVLVDVRAALSRLVLVLTMPKGLDVAARDGIGPVVTLPGFRLHFPETWPEPLDCPFEVAALKLVGPQSTLVALRLLTPKAPRPRWRPVSRYRRRGQPAQAMALFREKVLEMATARRWPPAVAALFAAAASGRRTVNEGAWPVQLAAVFAGLIMQDIATGRFDMPTAKRFAAVWFVAQDHYDRVRAGVDSRIRSPLAMLRLVAAAREFSPSAPVPPAVSALVTDLHAHAGFDLRDAAQARALRTLVKRAASLGTTTRRAPSRVRTEWIAVPTGFVTSEPRAARLDPTGWVFLHDRMSFEAALSELRSRSGDGPEPASLPVGPPSDLSLPVHFYVLKGARGVSLAGPGFDPDDLAWIMPATFRLSGWRPRTSSPPTGKPSGQP